MVFSPRHKVKEEMAWSFRGKGKAGPACPLPQCGLFVTWAPEPPTTGQQLPGLRKG